MKNKKKTPVKVEKQGIYKQITVSLNHTSVHREKVGGMYRVLVST